jgi:PleD family two-component response regulator
MMQRARILVADDSLVIRSVLRKQLQEHGHVVTEAVDGEDALRAIRDETPDVVLLDVEMPKMSGHAVLAELRSNPATAHIPVVFLTARATTADVVEGLRLGAHDYLRKPFEPAELLARVSAALRVKRLQDELRIRNIELEASSRTDALTGLPNRRHLQEQLAAAASASRRHGGSVAVLMVDVDHFKRVNDRLGHAGAITCCAGSRWPSPPRAGPRTSPAAGAGRSSSWSRPEPTPRGQPRWPSASAPRPKPSRSRSTAPSGWE